MIVITLLGVGMLQARVLPRVPVALSSFAPVGTVFGLAVGSSLSRTSGIYVVWAGLTVATAGLVWLGLVMWREPALDVRTGAGPLATA